MIAATMPLPEPPPADGKFLPFHTQPEWLPSDMAAALLQYAFDNEARLSGGRILHSGRVTIDESIRRTSVLGSLGPFEAPVTEAALAIQPGLAKMFGVPAFSPKQVEIELAAHGDGAHFQQHIDTFVVMHKDRSPRVLTLVLYLHRQPSGFSGGAIRMHALGGSAVTDIAPDHNLLVAFPSFAPHSVQPVVCPSRVFADRRFAVNMWIHR
jgi:SM-20-related protein